MSLWWFQFVQLSALALRNVPVAGQRTRFDHSRGMLMNVVWISGCLVMFPLQVLNGFEASFL
jgi:hypothetical protein